MSTGILVAAPGSSADRSHENALDSDISQFKYKQVIKIQRTMGISNPPNPAPSVSIQIPHGLTYLPSFISYIQGYKGNWGVGMRGAQAPILYDNWPYFIVESVDSRNYNATITVNSLGAIAQHLLTLKVILLYDEVQDVGN